jgi:hypothetical protein
VPTLIDMATGNAPKTPDIDRIRGVLSGYSEVQQKRLEAATISLLKQFDGDVEVSISSSSIWIRASFMRALFRILIPKVTRGIGGVQFQPLPTASNDCPFGSTSSRVGLREQECDYRLRMIAETYSTRGSRSLAFASSTVRNVIVMLDNGFMTLKQQNRLQPIPVIH